MTSDLDLDSVVPGSLEDRAIGALVGLADMDRLNATPNYRDVARSLGCLRHYPPLEGHGDGRHPAISLACRYPWKSDYLSIK